MRMPKLKENCRTRGEIHPKNLDRGSDTREVQLPLEMKLQNYSQGGHSPELGLPMLIKSLRAWIMLHTELNLYSLRQNSP
jgi:hypothetical protein